MKVSVPGFETEVRNNIELQVQQTARIDFTLAVGQATQTIEVAANRPLLSTENATVGTVIEQQRISELPLNGRSFFSLVALSPNVTFGFTPAAAGQQPSGRHALHSHHRVVRRARHVGKLYAGRHHQHRRRLQHLHRAAVRGGACRNSRSSPESIPRSSAGKPGQVNVSTKPGTNSYHGTAFEFLRNDVLDARPYDFSAATRSATNPSPKSNPYRQNQFGFTLGGPVQIPKLFNGKNRLFFMSNFEGFHSRQTLTNFATTLTRRCATEISPSSRPRCRTALTRAGTYPNIASSPFPGNQIPASRIDKNSVLLMKFFPLPNQPATTGAPIEIINTWPIRRSTRTRSPNASISPRAQASQWFGRYSWTNEDTVTPGITTNDGQTLNTTASQWVLSNVRIFSPTKVNEARFGYSSLFNNITQQLAGVENVDAEIGVPVAVTDKNSWGIPNIQLTNNLTSFGNPTSSPFQINDKVFSVGGQFLVGASGSTRCAWAESTATTSFRSSAMNSPAASSFSMDSSPTPLRRPAADRRLLGRGLPDGRYRKHIIAVALASANFTNSEWAAYVDDTWKVLPHLTITPACGGKWRSPWKTDPATRSACNSIPPFRRSPM